MKQSTSWSLREGGGSVELVSSRRVGGIALLTWIGDLKCQSSAGKNRQPPNICTSTEEIFDLRPKWPLKWALLMKRVGLLITAVPDGEN
ncbi:hypothetical protein T4D_451 [Trichinella pseudospiralis]|uniref:Uncharacterized protein n=1 Tax=Trichinella pseudospiralis TaxID=6337 RepID=A0A0V1FRF5_TRIPS|nr:hypothetical protein T4D_451 [Trichinella pseudospiralis]